MDSYELTALRAQIAVAIAASLAAETSASAQEKIGNEEARDLIATDLTSANLRIAQPTATRSTNTVTTVPAFCLTLG